MRCPECTSTEIRFVDGYGPTGVTSPDGGCEMESWEAVKCLECGQVSGEAIEIPALDALDAMLEYYAEAPLGEPPAVPTAEPRRPAVAASGLTRRELQVAELVSMGKTNKEIARVFFTVEYTVRNQIASIFRKVGVENRTQLALWYLREQVAA